MEDGQTGVYVPIIYINDNYYIKAKWTSFSLSSLTYALIYEEEKGKKSVEIVTTFPDSTYLYSEEKPESFSGIVYVEDWNGKLIKSIRYINGEMFLFDTKKFEKRSLTEICSVSVDWYTCGSSDGGGSWSCHFSYSETTFGSCEGSGGGGGCTNCSNYGPSGEGGGGGGGSFTTGTEVVENRNCNICPVGTVCLANGFKKIPLDDGTGTSSGGSADCPPCSCPNEDITTDCPSGQVKNNKGDCVDPCDMIASLSSNTEFTNKMNALKSNTSNNYEKAYLISTNIIGANSYTEYNGNAGEHFVSLPQIPMNGYIHNHFNGGESTFSVADIKAIYDFYTKGLIQDLGTFYIGVTTAQGTSYTIHFSDISLFEEFGLNNLNNAVNFQDFTNYYYNNFNINTQVYSFDEIVARELAMLKALENSGLILTKGNSDFTEWKIIEDEINRIINVECN